MQAHAGAERALLPGVLDAWRVQAVVRGIDRETVKQVSGVLLRQLRKERPQVAPEVPLQSVCVVLPADDALIDETYTSVQRSRDGPREG